ncbi:MAG: PAS-domain containing protein, partial [Polyangiales bacterium]
LDSGDFAAQNAHFERTRPNGVVLEVRTERLPDGGAVRTYTDITERRRNERALAAARDAAEAAGRARSEFLAVMSHEIRTPMNGVIGMIDVLEESHLQPSQRDMVRTARRRGLAVSISTNGILVPRRIQEIREANFVKISVDGPAAIHDSARGEGSYEKAIVGARVAKEHGLTVAIRMTLAEHNVRMHRHVLAVAQELGVLALFQPAIGSLFDASKHEAAHSPHVVAYRETIDDLIALKKAGAPIANEFLALRHLRNWPEPVPMPFCGGGRVMAAVGPEGGVYPCGRVGRDQEAPNAFEHGAKQAFSEVLRPTDCASCWCTLTLANCYAYRFDPRLLEGRLYNVPEDMMEQLLPEEAAVLESPKKLVQIRKKYR